MYQKEVPKLNKEIFTAWKSLMKLYIVGIGDSTIYYLDNEYVTIPAPMKAQKIKDT